MGSDDATGTEAEPTGVPRWFAQRVAHCADDLEGGRDPQFLRRVLPVIDGLLRYFDPVVEGFDRLPEEGPFLVVGNHSGGIYMPDFWAFLSTWLHRRGPEAPLYALGFDFNFSVPGMSDLSRKLGAVPASPGNGAALLERGHPVVVYPGGDQEDYRPWTQRHRVGLQGHTGFVKLALGQRVPVVPLVSHGSHDAIVVLSRGDNLARLLHFDRLRINVMPLVAGPPWGIAPAQLPTWPLPSKVTVRVCEPIRWDDLDPSAVDDEGVVRRCYEQVEGRMQQNMDDMVEALPHPVLSRVGTALGLDRFRR